MKIKQTIVKVMSLFTGAMAALFFMLALLAEHEIYPFTDDMTRFIVQSDFFGPSPRYMLMESDGDEFSWEDRDALAYYTKWGSEIKPPLELLFYFSFYMRSLFFGLLWTAIWIITTWGGPLITFRLAVVADLVFLYHCAISKMISQSGSEALVRFLMFINVTAAPINKDIVLNMMFLVGFFFLLILYANRKHVIYDEREEENP
ncbi:MAG TPA: hypothetical protein P5077_02215 [bacterium]|nr:hypothetical protein [bacterium]